jgi:eukaryotic-like serine/threonine-protein kinase
VLLPILFVMSTRFPKFPGYHVIQLLGNGPSCLVHGAIRLEDGRRVAIKSLRSEWLGDATALRLLEREAAAGQAVDSPNVVRIHDYIDEGNPHIIMDWLLGQSLRERLRQQGRLPSIDCVEFLIQMAEGLRAIHFAGYIHGDIKPENVWILPNGTARLIDLGFAHEPGEVAEMAEKGYVLGTANYLAPELCGQICRDETYNDLFSLGVMAFEMLAGKLPFPLDTPIRTMQCHRDQTAEQLADLQGDWPADLAYWVDRLTERNPAERPRLPWLIRGLERLRNSKLRRVA